MDTNADKVVVTKARYVEEVTEYPRDFLETEIQNHTNIRDNAQAEIDRLSALLAKLPIK